MVVQNLVADDYQSKEARLFFLKQRADLVSDFIRGLRSRKNQAYQQIMAEVTGVEALVTMQSFLLQVSLYYRKFMSKQILEIFEIGKAHEAMALYYNGKDMSKVISYMKELKELFELVKE